MTLPLILRTVGPFAALAVGALLVPAYAGLLTEPARAYIASQLFRAKTMSNAKAALEFCGTAEL